jgi:hypothetical protein
VLLGIRVRHVLAVVNALKGEGYMLSKICTGLQEEGVFLLIENLKKM